MNLPRGNLTLIFFKLCSLAPLTSINKPFPLRRFWGTSIFLFPDKYCPVIESLQFITSSGVPAQMTCPPWTPAPGPISTIKSEAFIVSSSCSTTRTLFPKSLISCKDLISFSLSLWCKPIDGSSKTYNTPVRRVPIWVARRIRWASPPDNPPARLASVK